MSQSYGFPYLELAGVVDYNLICYSCAETKSEVNKIDTVFNYFRTGKLPHGWSAVVRKHGQKRQLPTWMKRPGASSKENESYQLSWLRITAFAKLVSTNTNVVCPQCKHVPLGNPPVYIEGEEPSLFMLLNPDEPVELSEADFEDLLRRIMMQIDCQERRSEGFRDGAHVPRLNLRPPLYNRELTGYASSSSESSGSESSDSASFTSNRPRPGPRPSPTYDSPPPPYQPIAHHFWRTRLRNSVIPLHISLGDEAIAISGVARSPSLAHGLFAVARGSLGSNGWIGSRYRE